MVRPLTPARVPSVFQRAFPDGQLVVVSNRQPYAHAREESGEIALEHPAGGLAHALDPVLQALGGTWIAWGHGSADRETVDEADRIRVPPDDPSYTLRRLWLSAEEIENYYLGYSNQTLWPLCHNILAHVRFRDRFWSAYCKVNTRFGRAVVEELGERGGLVWLHDYHLALAPETVRELRPDVALAHFWHIPWPAWETFRVCPEKVPLLQGLLANDLLGFHLESFADNFVAACASELDAFVDRDKRAVVYRGHMTHVGAFPISIDVQRFEEMAASPETEARMARIIERFGLVGQKVGVGVDRLDYSKGILERLAALNALFARHPDLLERFTFIQIAAPSRTEIPAYQHLEEKVDLKIEELNRDLRTERWQPVVYLKHPLPQDELTAFYRLADLVVISSVQDGMNLVVKEFVASQGDDPGAVCLSEFAGAADELGHSIPVNPYYTEGFADDLWRALNLSIEDRRRHMEAMKTGLSENTIYTWMADFLKAAGAVRAEATAEFDR
ncbi:MAG TPA: trehalose-6-phosphate synthase [Gemmatimonadota bacterium]|nr:trehalose-6-phosphate synthase [Gemmatimonadota bacterium]